MGSASAGVGSALPSQDGFSGYVLTTDGVTASWEPSSASLPSQGGNSGKFLTTNGTSASWGTVSALPDQTGNNGKFLTTNGTAASWGTVTGVTTGDQSWDGVKTFTSNPVAAGISAPTTSGFTLAGNVTTGGSAVGVTVDNLVALTTAGAKIASFQNHEVEKAYVDKDGVIAAGVGATNGEVLVSPTADGTWPGIKMGSTAYLISQNGFNTILVPEAAGFSIGSAGTVNIIAAGPSSGVHHNFSAKSFFTSTDLSGTPGAGTADTPAGTAAVVASSAAAFKITNSTATAGSLVFVSWVDSDATAGEISAALTTGGFNVSTTGTPTGNSKFNWLIIN